MKTIDCGQEKAAFTKSPAHFLPTDRFSRVKCDQPAVSSFHKEPSWSVDSKRLRSQSHRRISYRLTVSAGWNATNLQLAASIRNRVEVWTAKGCVHKVTGAFQPVKCASIWTELKWVDWASMNAAITKWKSKVWNKKKKKKWKRFSSSRPNCCCRRHDKEIIKDFIKLVMEDGAVFGSIFSICWSFTLTHAANKRFHFHFHFCPTP